MYLPNIGIVDDLIHATEKYSKEKDEDGYETITLESDKSVELINEYLEDESDSNAETYEEYHRRNLNLEENVWRAIEEASGKSFIDFEDGQIIGIYDENDEDVIVY
jgi:hypothetical protein